MKKKNHRHKWIRLGCNMLVSFWWCKCGMAKKTYTDPDYSPEYLKPYK